MRKRIRGRYHIAQSDEGARLQLKATSHGSKYWEATKKTLTVGRVISGVTEGVTGGVTEGVTKGVTGV